MFPAVWELTLNVPLTDTDVSLPVTFWQRKSPLRGDNDLAGFFVFLSERFLPETLELTSLFGGGSVLMTGI